MIFLFAQSGISLCLLAPTVAPTATATGITNITTDEAAKNAPVYNLAGQKVTKAYKGVVIKNGKKMIQK